MTHTQTQGADGAGTITAGQTMVLLPMDDPRRPLNDSGLPSVMIWAGGEAYDDLTADKAIDLDSCSLAVGIYRAMTEAHAKEIATLTPPAALASPRADSDERTAGKDLAEACKPWELCFGVPPEYDSPLHGVFVSGMIYTERLLAGLLGVTDYEQGDGSEDFDADATQTLRNILTGARLWDADENRPVSATPAQPAGAVPDSLREAFAAATDSPVFVHDFADPAVSSAPGCQDVSLSFVTPDHITAAFMGNGLAGTIDQARKDAVALAAAWNHVRALIAAQPAGRAGDAGAAETEAPEWLVEFVRSSAHTAQFHALTGGEYRETAERAYAWANDLQSRRAEMLRTASECEDAQPGSGAYRRGVAQGIAEALTTNAPSDHEVRLAVVQFMRDMNGSEFEPADCAKLLAKRLKALASSKSAPNSTRTGGGGDGGRR